MITNVRTKTINVIWNIFTILCIIALINGVANAQSYSASIFIEQGDTTIFSVDVDKTSEGDYDVMIEGVDEAVVARLMVRGLGKRTNSKFRIAGTIYNVEYCADDKTYSVDLPVGHYIFPAFGKMKSFVRQYIVAELLAMPSPDPDWGY